MDRLAPKRMPRIGLILLAAALLVAGCEDYGTDGDYGSGRETDPTPTKLDDTESTEFEAGDIERAEAASPAVQDYCSGAVSEAQEAGCLSHVDESEIP